jgi:hypothetical protein
MPDQPSVSSEQSTHRSIAPAFLAGPVGWVPSWPWIVGLAAMLRALATPLALLHDPDTYWHIAAGNWMLAHHALPSADPFSHSMPGAPWLAGEWLGEIILAATYDLAGWGGIVVLTVASFGAAIVILTWFLLRRLEPLPTVIAALAGAMLVLPHLLARPHVLALPLLVLWCGGLLAARDDGPASPWRTPPWRLLPVLTLWTNIHGSFLFGLALAGFLAGEAMLRPAPHTTRLAEARRWGGFLAAGIVAALVNPNGVVALVQPFRLMAMPALQSGFGEWLPANLAEFPALEAWLLGLVALAFLCRARLPWTRLVLLLGLVHMTLAHVRHADLLGLVAPLAIVAALGPALAELTRPAAASPLLRGAAFFARPARFPAQILALALVAAIILPVLVRPIDRAGDAVTPEATLGAARRMHFTGPVFNSEAFGGYLIFSGIPVFIDGRIEMYGNDFLAAYLAAEHGEAATLANLLARYHIGWTLVQTQSPLATALDRLPGWHRAYADDQAVIHVPN